MTSNKFRNFRTHAETRYLNAEYICTLQHGSKKLEITLCLPVDVTFYYILCLRSLDDGSLPLKPRLRDALQSNGFRRNDVAALPQKNSDFPICGHNFQKK